ASREYKPGNFNDYLNQMKTLALHLMNIRPSMGTINNQVGDILFRLVEKSKTTSNLKEMKIFFNNKVKMLNRNSERNMIDVTKNCIKLFPNQCTILTHSYSSTVIGAIKFAYNKKKKIQVIVTESRPLFEGRKTANELSEYGVLTTLVTDAAAGLFIKNVDMVLLGADSLLTNGEVINKSGTYPIALAAAYQGIPVYIAADTGKINLRSYFTQILLEEKETSEIWMNPPSNVSIRNLYFDTTPKFFITRVITEMQKIRPEELLDLSREFIMDRYII
ncbi:translation initiation factor eIF-2B, partial [Thermoproteota archaeon]